MVITLYKVIKGSMKIEEVTYDAYNIGKKQLTWKDSNGRLNRCTLITQQRHLYIRERDAINKLIHWGIEEIEAHQRKINRLNMQIADLKCSLVK